jgi:predicted MPP superfamily phosphohydrolase
MKTKRRKVTVMILIVLGLLLILVILDSSRLKIVSYRIENEKIGEPLRIALITDLHSCRYGTNQEALVQAVEKQQPDIILLGGDIFDDEVPHQNSRIFLSRIAQKYPCFYVSGNHEFWSGEIETLKDWIRDQGITVLEGDCQIFEANGSAVNLCGIDDPTYIGMEEIKVQAEHAYLSADPTKLTLLLTHRPELADLYREIGFDLVLAGHAHGGQWRIPGILNGLLAPDQGLFPKYAGGAYQLGSTTMIVSRGLARESTLVPRIFNRPELVVIDLLPEAAEKTNR